MKLDAAYMKYINARINPVTMVKSSGLNGVLAAIYRVFHLKNNYCLYEGDRILYITKNKGSLDRAREAYNRLKGESDIDDLTLFSFLDDRVDFKLMDDIIQNYFKKYNLKNPSLKSIDEKTREEIIKSSFEKARKEYKSLKLFKNENIKFFSDEIKWMKAFGHTNLEVYQNCLRSGRGYQKGEGPGSIRKNSRAREGIFKVFTLYEDNLRENSLIDLEDMERLALEEVRKDNKYTHIIIDEARLYTKNQLEITKLLKDNKAYGETAYIYNHDDEALIHTFLIKPNKISELYCNSKIKSFNFKNPMEMELLSIFNGDKKPEISKEAEVKDDASIEKFEFISLKNGSEFEFIRDITRKDSIVLLDGENQEEVGTDEIREIPVFSNIAAGEPILMNPDVEDTFYLPEYWVRGMDNHFILHVKGDSMINANINDGDFVVIKSTQFAQNRDIVAVNIDGSATLKRLMINGKTAVLMPENNKYRPIVITEEGAHILGVAVGLVKEKF